MKMPILDRPHGGRRDNRRNMLTPMGERWNGHTGDLVADLVALVQWMAVDSSFRWMPHPGRTPGKLATYCDHYACDFMEQLTGQVVLSAWVWWLPEALEAIREGQDVEPVRGETVREHGARSLHAWLPEFGDEFGWRSEKNVSGLKAVLNSTPTVGLITTPTHVAIALPDACGDALGVTPGGVVLTSQAGSRNAQAWRKDDWFRRNADTRFYSFPFPKPDPTEDPEHTETEDEHNQ